MDDKAKKSIELVIFHCDLFLYGHSGTPQIAFNNIARLYNLFAGLHLISTMFLIQDSKKNPKPMGGFCYRVLEPLGLTDLLKDIQQILETPLAKTTFGDFIRLSRNRLATHGDLSLERMLEKALSLTKDRNAVDKFEELMDELAGEVDTLRDKLKELVSQKPL